MAAVRLLQTTSRAALPFSRTLARRHLAIARYSSTAAATTPAAVNSTAKSGPASEPVPPLPDVKGHDGTTDWSRSYSGLSVQPFAKEVAEILQATLETSDVEIKPGECCSIPDFSRERLIFLRWPFIFA
jgi:hypothetical protein